MSKGGKYYGKVCLNKADEKIRGADQHTNNTAELTAQIMALGYAGERMERTKENCIIHYDSTYAANMTAATGRQTTTLN
jgi:ribonuclease HI